MAAQSIQFHERRRSARANVKTDCYFNILHSIEEYSTGHVSFLKRLRLIDSVKPPASRTESQILLARIDQKLSILVEIMAEKASGRKSYLHHATSVDISEHGVAFIHPHLDELKLGALLEIGFELPVAGSLKILEFASKVAHIKESPDPEDTVNNIYGVEFVEIKGKDQNEIVQWIFDQQRDQLSRQRGK